MTAEQIACVAGWCDDEHVEEAKQVTHDTLIEMLGSARRSGVKWYVVRKAEGADRLIYKMITECRDGGVRDDEPILKHYLAIRDRLTLFGGVLVVASASGER